MSDSQPPAKRIKTGSDHDRQLYASWPRLDLEELYNVDNVTINVCSPSAVDKEAHTFTIPRALVCLNSAYFQGAFKGGFQESKTMVTSIENTDYKVFACFINFLYTRTLTSAYKWDNPDEQADDPSTWKFATLFALYIFADKYDSKDFRMAVFEQIQLRAEDFFPTVPTLETMCENLLPSGPLYRFIVHLRLSAQDVEDDLQMYPTAFLAACLDQAMRRSRALICGQCRFQFGPNIPCDDTTHAVQKTMFYWKQEHWCQFHEHSKGREKELCELKKKANDLRAEDDIANYG